MLLNPHPIAGTRALRAAAPAPFALATGTLLLAAACAGHAAVAPGAAGKPAPAGSAGQCVRVETAPLVRVPVGKSLVLHPEAPIARILLGNPENAHAARPAEGVDASKDAAAANRAGAAPGRPGVADIDVLLLAPTELYLLGRSVGSTNVVMLDRAGTCTTFDVVVGMDTAGLESTIATLLPQEKNVKVTAAFDSIVLSGAVSDAEALARVTDLANAYLRGSDTGGKANPRLVNMLEVGAPQQVMLEVKVAEISKSLLDQFGIDFSRAYTTGSMLRFLSGVFGGSMGAVGQIGGGGPNGVPYSSVDQVVGGTVPIPNMAGGNVTVTYDANGRPTYTTSYGTVPGRGATNVGINMQKNDGLVKVLAEPTVMAISGQTGSFLAGGKIFIPVTQDNGAGGRTVTLEEKEFGVSLKFTPTVLGSGLINLRVRPEVSELNAAGVQVSAGGVSAVLPSFTSRKAETTVQLMDGQSFAIGGLIKNNTTTNVTAFPLLGELPVIGALFRSTSFQTDKSELVFVITPRLVKPLPPGYRLPTDDYVPPTRSELIWDGKIEGSRPDPSSHAAAAPAEGGFEQEKH